MFSALALAEICHKLSLVYAGGIWYLKGNNDG